MTTSHKDLIKLWEHIRGLSSKEMLPGRWYTFTARMYKDADHEYFDQPTFTAAPSTSTKGWVGWWELRDEDGNVLEPGDPKGSRFWFRINVPACATGEASHIEKPNWTEVAHSFDGPVELI